MSARFSLSMRLFFTTCLCLCVCLAAGCSGKQVHVTVENEFNTMAKRLAPVLKAHSVIDEHGAYVAPVFSTPELPPQLGEYLFQRLSPAFRFKVDPALLPPTFALSRTAGDTVEMQPYGFMPGHRGRSRSRDRPPGPGSPPPDAGSLPRSSPPADG